MKLGVTHREKNRCNLNYRGKWYHKLRFGQASGFDKTGCL